MPHAELQELGRLIRRLKELAEQAHRASASIPAAEKNLYMVLQHLEMLEIEVCDPLEALTEGQEEVSHQEGRDAPHAE